MNTTDSLLLQASKLARGAITLPGSKSISNRVLLLAALAKGTTNISGLLASDDTKVMLTALDTLGLDLQQTSATTVSISGQASWPNKSAKLFLGNAGTAFRPLTAVLALMAGNYQLSGVARMHERPIADLVTALQAIGCNIQYLGQSGYPPLAIQPAQLRPGQNLQVRGSVSSQFLTALLMAAPLIAKATAKDVVIEVMGELISKPYILITLNLMAKFGVKVEQDNWQKFTIPANAEYISPGSYQVEGDASSASYFLGLGTIAGGPIEIKGVGRASIQGDMAFAEVVQAMGAQVNFKDHSLVVSGINVAAGQRLRAFDADFNLIPDAAMTAAVMALYADGPCQLRNIASWRVKETDRIAAMQAELSKLGATVSSTADSLTVNPMSASAWRSADIATYDDHRMAMCFSLAAFGSVAINILDPNCVSKTYPDYFSDYQGLIQA